MHTNFRNFLCQYSRRLLSILAQIQKIKHTFEWAAKQRLLECVLLRYIDLFNNLHSCAIQKKCGAHTHAHYLSQLPLAIFTSVVVYSRTFSSQHNKHSVVIFNDITKKDHCARSTIIIYFLLTNFLYKRSSIFAKKWWSCFHTLRVGVFR